MKTLSILLSGLFVFTLTTEANVAIWKQKLTTTTTGAGLVTKQTATGFLIVDATNNAVLFLNVDSKRGVFQFAHPDTFEIHVVSAGVTKTGDLKDSTVMCFIGSVSGALTLKGRNSEIDLFVNDPHRIPKTMTASGSILKKDGDTYFLQEFVGTYTYSVTATGDANVFDHSLSETEARLREHYLELGYTEQ